MTFLLSFPRMISARQSTLVLALAVAILSASSCGVRDKRENLKNCEYELENLEVGSFSFTAVELIVHVGVKNPNPSDVVVDRLDFELFTGNDKVAEGKHLENVVIPAGERKVVKLDVKTSTSQVGNTLLRALMSGGAVDYRVEGIVYLDTILGEIPYPIKIEGNTAEDGANGNESGAEADL